MVLAQFGVHCAFQSRELSVIETIAMRRRPLTALAAAAGLVFASAPLLAHHSNAAFDASKRLTITGSVTEWFWANPHCLLSLDVKDGRRPGRAMGGRDTSAAQHDPVWLEQAILQAGGCSDHHARARGSGKPVGRLLRAVFADGKNALPGGVREPPRCQQEEPAMTTRIANFSGRRDRGVAVRGSDARAARVSARARSGVRRRFRGQEVGSRAAPQSGGHLGIRQGRRRRNSGRWSEGNAVGRQTGTSSCRSLPRAARLSWPTSQRMGSQRWPPR